MDEKTILIGGMADRIIEQSRQVSDLKRQQAILDRMDANNSSKEGSGELKSKLEMERDHHRQSRVELQEARDALAMKDELLKEWMHSNEAFKRLARKYGKKLGVSDEQRTQDFRDEVLAVAEEDPNLDSRLTGKVKESLAKESGGKHGM